MKLNEYRPIIIEEQWGVNSHIGGMDHGWPTPPRKGWGGIDRGDALLYTDDKFI